MILEIEEYKNKIAKAVLDWQTEKKTNRRFIKLNKKLDRYLEELLAHQKKEILEMLPPCKEESGDIVSAFGNKLNVNSDKLEIKAHNNCLKQIKNIIKGI